MSFEIGEFGNYQKLFKNRKRKNHGYIEKLNVTSGEINSNKYFQMVFIPKLSRNDIVKHRFTVRFEKHNEVDCMITITVNSQNDVHTLKSQHDNSTVDKMCSEWLVEVLFRKNYQYKEVSLTLPTIFDWDTKESDGNMIFNLEINVDNRDNDIVNSWLSKFPCAVEILHIKSNQFPLELEDSLCLRQSQGVKISGNVNINIQLIKNLNANVFIHRGERFKEFTLEEMKELWKYCYSLEKIKAMSLQQSTETNGRELINWIIEMYGGGHVDNHDYYLGKKKEHILYCKTCVNEIKFGVFNILKEAEMDSDKWFNEFNFRMRAERVPV